jgi:hypothetical protein
LSEARKAILLGESGGLCLHLRVRFVQVLATVEFRHVLVGGHEVLNQLLGELNLLQLLRSGRAVIEQSERQKCREQQTQKTPTPGHRVPVPNERHGMVLHLDPSLASDNFGRAG